ncbi:hypothetical protein AX16_009481 [Volvariella volvacea WC 439]|nr:hypothetical protein AX16_009481 [Volvariella volvacea WC 439]
MSEKLVLVTGVTGFIAGHVVLQLLEQGYKVRGTARGSKVNGLTETIKLPRLEFVRIDDVATGDFTEALKSVDAVVHVASPLPGHASVDDTLNTAIDGTLNVVKQAAAAGISKVVVTSSFGSVLDPSLRPGFAGLQFTDSQWGEVTRAQVLEKGEDPYYVYFASKILAERALWDYVKEHPELDIATILPGFVYGPFAKHFPFPSPSSLGTNGYVWALMNGQKPTQPPPFFVDVRDVAQAHVLALSLPATPDLEAKRFLVNAGNYTWKQAAQHLNKVRPDIKTASQEEFEELPGPASELVDKRAREVLGLKYIDFGKTVEDAVDSLLEAKKTWA